MEQYAGLDVSLKAVSKCGVMCGRPLVCKENLSICGLVDSGHVSGLFARYLMTAGLDGFRYLGPIQVYALARRLGVA